MDLIELARQLGAEIQNTEAYTNMIVATNKADADKDLQDAIGKFNLTRLTINNEAQKEDRDEELIRTKNEELRAIYAGIMENENMIAYNDAKTVLDNLVQRVTMIINMCAEGADPATADYDASASCGGNCSSCAGCH
ncbi:MAG: YlbF family regulator [Clostridia bacterium]|nr:YlbF family regulator [Clostridia bacterium]